MVAARTTSSAMASPPLGGAFLSVLVFGPARWGEKCLVAVPTANVRHVGPGRAAGGAVPEPWIAARRIDCPGRFPANGRAAATLPPAPQPDVGRRGIRP